jgi:hypothetical protein
MHEKTWGFSPCGPAPGIYTTILETRCREQEQNFLLFESWWAALVVPAGITAPAPPTVFSGHIAPGTAQGFKKRPQLLCCQGSTNKCLEINRLRRRAVVNPLIPDRLFTETPGGP